MKELNDIVKAYDTALSQNKQAALATVVKVDGSSYRRPGARMLVTEDGEITGAISGGCLEGDALRKAQFAIFQKKNKLEIYNTTDDEDNTLGVQLGCNGIVYILFEPILPGDENNPVNLLKKIVQQRRNTVITTAFNKNQTAFQKGTCCFINDAEDFCNDDTMETVFTEARLVLNKKTSCIQEDENGSVLYQFIPSSIQLIIAGAGNDVQPLVEISALLGWNVSVVDGRPAYATQQRFPKASKICVTKPTNILSAVTIDEYTAVVLMTHNYNYDIAALEQLVQAQCNYTGVLGPKKKLYKMFDELNASGIIVDENKMHAIYGPVGLDIGAETSEEIALSIIAEIKAVFAGRQGGSLREKETEIHNRTLILKDE